MAVDEEVRTQLPSESARGTCCANGRQQRALDVPLDTLLSVQPFWNRLGCISRQIDEPHGWLAQLGPHLFVDLVQDNFGHEPTFIDQVCKLLLKNGHDNVVSLLLGWQHFQDAFKPRSEICVQLPLPQDRVIWVSDAAMLSGTLADLTKANRLAFDSESGWVGDESRPALLQIASSERCYLLDLLAFGKDELMPFLEAVFCCEVLKLGWSCSTDLKLLGLNTSPVRYVVDLQELWDSRKKVRLAKAAQIVFKQPLCKKEQCSNWSRRPLRETQMHYAALDAVCLFAVAEHLEAGTKNLNRVWEEAQMQAQQASLQRGDAERQQEERKALRSEEFLSSLLQRCRRSMSFRGVLNDDTPLSLVCAETGQCKFTAVLSLNEEVLQTSSQKTESGARTSVLKAQLAEERRLALDPVERRKLVEEQVDGLLNALGLAPPKTPFDGICVQSVENLEEQLSYLQGQLDNEREVQVWSNCYQLEFDTAKFPLRFLCRAGYVVVKGHDPSLPFFPPGVSRGDVLLRIENQLVADTEDVSIPTNAIAALPRPVKLTIGRFRSELCLLTNEVTKSSCRS